MNAPDELSVLNCVANAAAFTVIDVVAARSDGASFKSAETRRNEAIEFVFGAGDPGRSEALRNVRNIELENVNVEANLDFSANEFQRHGIDVEAFDKELDT